MAACKLGNLHSCVRAEAPRFESEEFWKQYREWVFAKYAKSWAANLMCYARKYHGLLSGNLDELERFSGSKRNNVLQSLIALAKYLGVYREFKARMASYGVKWQRQDSLRAFLRMMQAKGDVLDWVAKAVNVLDDNKATFVKFVAVSGIRAGEAVKAFTLAIELSQADRLEDYYNSELRSLEHFKYPDRFIRGTKNVFFSFVPTEFIDKIVACNTVSYRTLRKHVRKHGLKLRLNELRDYYGTFLVHNGVIREEVDLLQGRIGKSMFMRHYFSPDIENLRNRVLAAVAKLGVLS